MVLRPFKKGGGVGRCGVVARYSPTLTEYPLTLTLSLLTCTCLSRFVMIYLYCIYIILYIEDTLCALNEELVPFDNYNIISLYSLVD